jgi:hypothetical protein
LFDKADPALVSGDQTTGCLPFSEILLFGELQGLDQPLIILVGANLFDSDASSDPAWIAKYGTECLAEDSQSAIGYLGCGRPFVDDDEMDSGKSRIQYIITVDPNACELMHEGLK